MKNNKNVILKKENGAVTEVSECPELDSKITHLCRENCVNAEPFKCTKFKAGPMQVISKYEYVTDGIQVLDAETNEVKRFVVTSCENYEAAKELTFAEQKENRAKRKELIESICTNYLDAADITEALKTWTDRLDAQSQRNKARR